METQPFKTTRSSSESADKIYKELTAHRTGTLATVGEDGSPQVTVVYYIIDDNFVTRFATKTGTRKHKSLQKDDRVQLLVFDEKRQLTIQITGIAEEILDGELRTKVVNKIYWLSNQNNGGAPPISKLYIGEYVAYRIKPELITMACFARSRKGGYDMFEKLEFS